MEPHSLSRKGSLKVTGMDDPVVQVIDESKREIVYTIRINGREFRPKVFAKGKYTIRVGEQPGKRKTFEGVEALGPDEPGEIEVDLR